jgi:hypothetical protein
MEAERGGGSLVAHGVRVGSTARIDVCAASPSIRPGPLWLFLFSHASMDDCGSALFRISDTSLSAMEAPILTMRWRFDGLKDLVLVRPNIELV